MIKLEVIQDISKFIRTRRKKNFLNLAVQLLGLCFMFSRSHFHICIKKSNILSKDTPIGLRNE